MTCQQTLACISSFDIDSMLNCISSLAYSIFMPPTFQPNAMTNYAESVETIKK